MNKKIVACVIGAAITLIGASEFTKKPTRKDKAQQEAACSDYLQAADAVIEQLCTVQGRLADLTGRLYKTLRSCAVEDKPEPMQQEASILRDKSHKLQELQKQLEELTKAVEAVENAL